MGSNALVGKTINTQVIKKEMESIENRFGMITPRRVLDVARNEKSPLHNLFEWDDSAAAENYRLLQAGQMIVRIKVQIEERSMSAFQPITIMVDEKPTNGYVSLARVMENNEFKSQILERAIKEINYWNKQYQDVEELGGIINEDKLEEAKQLVKK
jgi:hypothetical protein